MPPIVKCLLNLYILSVFFDRRKTSKDVKLWFRDKENKTLIDATIPTTADTELN